jgi:hypothetical protein
MKVVQFAVAAAAVVVAGVVGVGLMTGTGVGGQLTASPPASTTAPSVAPTPSVAPSVAAGPTALPLSGPLAAGTYIIGDPFRLRVSMDVTPGWHVWGAVSSAGAGIFKDSPNPPAGMAIVVTIVDEVFMDACDMNKGNLDPGPTANDLAVALANQAGTQASAITDVTLAGYSGKYVEYNFVSPNPDCVSLDRWPMSVGPREAIRDEHDKVWILDVDGVRLVIDEAYFPGASAADLADMRAIVESMTITP